jgi:hypothetical protein
MMARARAVAALVTAAILAGGAGAARAAEAKKPDAHAAAVDHFEKGKKLGEVGRYEDSIKEFEEAYLLEPLPDILLNIALNHRYLKHLDKAIELYQRYLRLKPDAANRKEVEKLIAELEKERAAAAAAAAAAAKGSGDGKSPPPSGTGRVTISCDPAGARLSEGGKPLGEAPVVIELEPGSHILHFEYPGFSPKDVGVFVEPGHDATVAAALVPMGTVSGRMSDTGLGKLTITTNLPGAAVRLDGVEFGYLPISERAVPAGEHRLSMIAPGFTDRFVEILIGRDSTTEMHVDLLPAHPRSVDTFEAHYDKFLASGLTIDGYRRLRTGHAHVGWGIATIAASTLFAIIAGVGVASGNGGPPAGALTGIFFFTPGAAIGGLYIYGGLKKSKNAHNDKWDHPPGTPTSVPASLPADVASYGLPPLAGGASAPGAGTATLFVW